MTEEKKKQTTKKLSKVLSRNFAFFKAFFIRSKYNASNKSLMLFWLISVTNAY